MMSKLAKIRKIFTMLIMVLAAVSAGAVAKDIEVVTDTFRLPGTLELPEKTVGKVPCVVFVHGSGPNDRDETLGPNKFFKDLADSLAANGIASVRYDKRTLVYRANFVPEGEQPNYDFETIDDAVSAVKMVQKMPEIDSERVFVLGHSLGAMLAPEIARRVSGVAGVIMVAPPAQKLLELMIYQSDYLKDIYAELGASDAVAMMEQMKKQAENAQKLGTPEYDEEIGLPQGLTESYILADKSYDAVATAKSLSCRMFLLFGMRDYQVPYTQYTLWQKGLAGKRNAILKMYFGLNHIMRAGQGKPSPLDYSQKVAMSAEVAKDIVMFVSK